jgi:hypothetical protein
MATKFKIVEDAKRQARMIFVGMAIPCDKSTVDGGMIRSEKILKFSRKALKNMNSVKADKVDPRYNGGEDTMIVKVGQRGSRERIEALRLQYEAIEASGENLSPFGWEA